MSTTFLLRLAAIFAAVQGVVHGTLFLRAQPRSAAEAAVVATMQRNAFEFGGNQRTYWDFYVGYGLLAAIFVLVEAVLCWQLASIATTHPHSTRPIVALLVGVNGVHALLMLRYFFWVPILFDGLVGVTLLVALVVASMPANRPTSLGLHP